MTRFKIGECRWNDYALLVSLYGWKRVGVGVEPIGLDLVGEGERLLVLPLLFKWWEPGEWRFKRGEESPSTLMQVWQLSLFEEDEVGEWEVMGMGTDKVEPELVALGKSSKEPPLWDPVPFSPLRGLPPDIGLLKYGNGCGLPDEGVMGEGPSGE